MKIDYKYAAALQKSCSSGAAGEQHMSCLVLVH
jgi:hypothetical protein